MPNGLELDRQTAARAFGSSYFNLIRRGADGSLVLSRDHWRLAEHDGAPPTFRFLAQDAEAPVLVVPMADVTRVVWDRLPKQQVRSQIRFHFANGDVWTFSGSVDESALGAPESRS
jgi:hypothetical protein